MGFRTEHQVVSIDDVINHFISGYQYPEGESMANCEWFYDPAKGKFILQMMIRVDEVQGNDKG